MKSEFINKLISGKYVDVREEKGKTIYSSFIGDTYLNVTRHEPDFEYIPEWSNGWRWAYVSDLNLTDLTIVEGDLIITVYDSIEEFSKGLKRAEEFYKEY